MVKIMLLVIFYFTFPVFIIYLCKKWSFLQKLGAIVLAYLFGLILGTSGILPEGSSQYKHLLQGKQSISTIQMEKFLNDGTLPPEDKFVNQIGQVQETIPFIVVPLAFPLLLFSMNIKRWLKFAGKGFVSVALALVAGLIMVTAGFF